MNKKSFIVSVTAALIILFMFSAMLPAQSMSIEEAKKLWAEIQKRVNEIDKLMQKAYDDGDHEAYEKLAAERKSLVEESAGLKTILEGDVDTRKKITEIKVIFNDGSNELKLRRNPEAIAKFEEVIQKGTELDNPISDVTLVKAYYQMGVAYFRQKNYAKAKEAVEGAILVDSNYKLAYFLHGKIHSALKNEVDAINAYSRAKEIDPRYETAIINLGVIYINRKEYDKAISEFMEAISVNPQNGNIFDYMGRCYFEKQEYNSAQTALERAVELGPRQWERNYYLAQTYNKQGQFTDALKTAELVSQIKPKYGGGYIEQGLAYKGMGKKADALAAFEKAKSDRNFKERADWEIKWYDKDN